MILWCNVFVLHAKLQSCEFDILLEQKIIDILDSTEGLHRLDLDMLLYNVAKPRTDYLTILWMMGPIVGNSMPCYLWFIVHPMVESEFILVPSFNIMIE